MTAARALVARSLGLALGFAADRLFGDPPRHHPVAWFGALAHRVEQRWYRDHRRRGVLATGALVGAATALGAGIDAATRTRPAARVLTTALATWVVLGGRSLEREGDAIATLLRAGDLPGARERITHLVGRDPDSLDAAGIARAATESIAENTSDAVVAPLLWGGVAGIAGLLGHRASNTLDAMWGHRSPRLRHFGWAAARLDDAANLPGSRLCAALATCLAPGVGGDPRAALRAWRLDAPRHPSPNAGPVEAAFAGALGVHLGGTTVYGGRAEDRGILGTGPAPTAADLRRAITLATRVDRAALLTAASIPLVVALARHPGKVSN